MNQNQDIINRYPNAKEIWLLSRQKKLTKKERILDTLVGLFSPLPGIVSEADAFSDMGCYVLVVKPDGNLLVRFARNQVDEQPLTCSASERKFTVGQNIFKKVRRIHG